MENKNQTEPTRLWTLKPLKPNHHLQLSPSLFLSFVASFLSFSMADHHHQTASRDSDFLRDCVEFLLHRHKQELEAIFFAAEDTSNYSITIEWVSCRALLVFWLWSMHAFLRVSIVAFLHVSTRVILLSCFVCLSSAFHYFLLFLFKNTVSCRVTHVFVHDLVWILRISRWFICILIRNLANESSELLKCLRSSWFVLIRHFSSAYI